MFILGKKQNMMQIFNDDGKCFPVTIVEVGPVTVTQLKEVEKDGYAAVQFGYDKTALDRVNKPARGHAVKSGSGSLGFKTIKEWRLKNGKTSDLKVGDVIDSSVLIEGEKVTVSSISKGKGFQSVIKRHGFKGQPRSHGQKHSENAPGSIGGGLRNKVPKGMRMAGRMGNDRITSKGLSIIKVEKDSNLVLIKGAIPGRRGTLVEIYK